MMAEQQKTDKKYADQTAQKRSEGLQPTGERKSAGEQERDQDTEQEGSDIQNEKILSQKGGIGIEKNRNQKRPCNDPEAQC